MFAANRVEQALVQVTERMPCSAAFQCLSFCFLLAAAATMPVTHATMHSSAVDGAERVTKTVHRACVPEATGNGARSRKAAVAMSTHAPALDDALTMSALSARMISFITIPLGGNPLMPISPGLSSLMAIFSGLSPLMPIPPGFGSLMAISPSFGPGHMSIMFTMRRFGRMIGAAHQLTELKTGIMRNFSPTFTRFESRYYFSKSVTRGSGQ
jgi:hypothetical protein